MKGFTKLMALLLSTVLLLAGCSGSSTGEQTEEAMTVNGITYSMEDYSAAYRFQLMMQLGTNPEILFDEQVPEEQRTAIHQQTAALTQNFLMYLTFCTEKFQEYKLTLDDKSMALWTDGLTEAIGGRKVLHELANQWGLTLPELYRFLAVDTMILQIQSYIQRDDPTADLEYLQENYLRCKHILISDQEGSPDKEALAKEVAEKAKSGENFDQLIFQYNEDPGMFQNPRGYLFTAGEMVEEFYQASLNLEENEVSVPVRSSFGWHVIQRLPVTEEDQMQRVQELYLEMFQQWLSSCEVNVSEAVQGLSFDAIMTAIPQLSASEEEKTPAA